MVSVPNPYVYQTLQSAIGKHVVIETVRGNVRGKLKDVKPDHLLIEDTVPYIVRIQQIVWILCQNNDQITSNLIYNRLAS